MRKIQRNFECDLASKAKGNPKAIWNCIKSKTRIGIGDLKTDHPSYLNAKKN
jgi:hypothetical protein